MGEKELGFTHVCIRNHGLVDHDLAPEATGARITNRAQIWIEAHEYGMCGDWGPHRRRIPRGTHIH